MTLKRTLISLSCLTLAAGLGAGVAIGVYFIFHSSSSKHSVDYYQKKANKELLKHIDDNILKPHKQDIEDFYLNAFSLLNEDTQNIKNWDKDHDFFTHLTENGNYGFQLFNKPLNFSKLDDLIQQNPKPLSSNIIYQKLSETPIGILLSITLPKAINKLTNPVLNVNDLFKVFWDIFPDIYSYMKTYFTEAKINLPGVNDKQTFFTYIENSLSNLIANTFCQDLTNSTLPIINNFQFPFLDVTIDTDSKNPLFHTITGQFLNTLLKQYFTLGVSYNYNVDNNTIDYNNLKYVFKH